MSEAKKVADLLEFTPLEFETKTISPGKFKNIS